MLFKKDIIQNLTFLEIVENDSTLTIFFYIFTGWGGGWGGWGGGGWGGGWGGRGWGGWGWG